jgi:hypothetical protein
MQHQDRLADAGLRNVEGQGALGNRDIDKAMRNPRQRRGTYVVGPGGSHGTHPELSHTPMDMLRGFAAHRTPGASRPAWMASRSG